MKNKSKLKKIKEKKHENGCPKEWLYLNPAEVSPREVAGVFDGENGMTAQLWEEAGVVEVELPEAKSVDLEWLKLPAGEEEFDAYLQKQQIKSVFLVTLVPEDYEKAKLAMNQIVGSLGGYFCGDNEDFSPVVK